MSDSDKSKALVDEIKNAPAPEELNASSPVVVPSEPVKAEVKPAKASTAAAPVVDKAAADRIKAEEKAAKKAEREQARKQAKIDKKAKKAAAYQEKVEQCPRDYRPVGTGLFFWSLFLCSIPVLGILFTLIFSVVPVNKNFKHFARAILSWYVIILILLLIFAIIVTFALGQSISDYIWPFEKFFSEMARALGF